MKIKCRITSKIIKSPLFVILAISLSLAALPAAAYEVIVPGDQDGDMIVSDEELQAAIKSNEDGTISSSALETIREIHDQYPREFTDGAGRQITMYKPAERIITTSPDTARMVIALGLGDKLIASEECVKNCICPTPYGVSDQGCMNCYETILDGRLAELPVIGTSSNLQYELIASLQPDLIVASSESQAEDLESKIDCLCVVASGTGWNYTYENGLYGLIQVMGLTLNREEEAENLIDFVESKVDLVRSVTQGLDDGEKPTVYIAPRGAVLGFYDPKQGRDFTRTEPNYPPVDIAGGLNVASGEPGSSINVALEQIIAWSPEYIFVGCIDPDAMSGLDNVRTAPDLQSVTAVEDDHVYYFFYPHCRGSPPEMSLFNIIYLAKVLHPDLFGDLDLEEEGNEIFKAFLGVDGVFTEYVDYLVWPREWLNAQ